MGFVSGRVGNILGKGENTAYIINSILLGHLDLDCVVQC